MLTWAFQGGVVLHASSSLGGEGVQECRYAWGGHDAAERDGGASGVGYSLAVPCSYPLDYPETHNPLAYFAALRRERGAVRGGDRLPTSGHEALPLGHGKSGLEPKAGRGSHGCASAVAFPGSKPTYGLTTMANRKDSQVKQTKPQTQEHPPLSKRRVLGDKTALLRWRCF